jgi:hypothetical protein
VVVLLLVATLGVDPAAAYPWRTDPGSAYISSDGNLYYHKGTTMLAPLSVFVVIFAALISDDDDDDSSSTDWSAWDTGLPCYDQPGDDSFPLEAVQLGGSAGVFVSRNLALGLRMVAQDNDKKDPVSGFWGGGPEVSWYPGPFRSPLRPFVSLSALYARGRVSSAARQHLISGPMYQARTGLSWFGSSGGIYVQASHQTTPRDEFRDLALTRSGWGAGMGLTFYLD